MLDLELRAELAKISRSLAHMGRLLVSLHRKVNHMSDVQDDIDAETATIEGDVTQINTGLANVDTEIASLEAQIAAGQTPDLTGLKAAVADLGTAATNVANAAPVPEPTPDAPTS